MVPVTFTTQQLPQISFGRMTGYYTRDFRTANVEAAVDYLALICLNSDLPGSLGKSQTALCHEALRELVLETREFASLLGDIRVDGTRFKGAIEQRLKLIGLADQEEFLKTVTVQAAVVADDNGRTTDAVLLYHLAEDYDNVTVVINRALSEAIATDIGQEPVRLQPSKQRATAQAGQQGQDRSSLSLTSVDDPAELARNMIGLYNVNAMYYRKIKPANREACGVLLRMHEAKSKVAAEQWDDALDVSHPPIASPSSDYPPLPLPFQSAN
jgi:nuclear pore complex protein Nup93